jgi:hypothetical protein
MLPPAFSTTRHGAPQPEHRPPPTLAPSPDDAPMLGIGVLSKPSRRCGSACSAECFRQVPVARSKVFPFQGVHQLLSGLAVTECGLDRVSVGATRSCRHNDSPFGSGCASMVAGMTRDRGSREPHRTHGSMDRGSAGGCELAIVRLPSWQTGRRQLVLRYLLARRLRPR